MTGPVVAAIDCGTNTIKLFIGRPPETFVREWRMVRLGQGVDTSGRLAEEALDRAFSVIEEYAALIGRYPVERIRFGATSATRDAANADVFAAGVRARLGVDPDVLSGEEEARLSFAGAVRQLRVAPAEPVLVIDIGGGSTELVVGRVSGPGGVLVEAAVSLNIGSVRMTERHLHTDPPSTGELAECVADIEAQLDSCPIDLASPRSVVGVAGSTLTIVAGVLDLPRFDIARIDQAALGVADIRAYVDRLTRLTAAERRTLPYLHPGRADVIVGGGLILDRVLRRTTAPALVASEADILDGIAWSIA